MRAKFLKFKVLYLSGALAVGAVPLPAQSQTAEQAIGNLIQGLSQLLRNAQTQPAHPVDNGSDGKPPASEQPEPSVAPVIATPSPASMGPQDWSAFFKTMENHCQQSEGMRSLFEGMRKKTIQLEQPWRSQVTKLAAFKKQDYLESVLSVKGTYYKLPVIEVGHYYGVENGISGYYLIFSAPLSTVKKSLSKVPYKKSKGEDENGEPVPQINIGNDDKGRAGVFCDSST